MPVKIKRKEGKSARNFKNFVTFLKIPNVKFFDIQILLLFFFFFFLSLL